MATEIKTIKCPQCGSVKVQELRTGYYRCESCGSEFFLDSNDINININSGNSFGASNNAPQLRKYSWIIGVGIVFLVILISIFINIFSSNSSNSATTNAYSASENDAPQFPKYLFSIPLSANGQGVAFYLIDKDNSNTYAVFQDIAAKKVIKEQKLAVYISDSQNVACQWFQSDSTHYAIVNGKFIYKIEPDNYSFTDVTAAICARKPALNAGLMSVAFVPEGQGEGFHVNTNLGKELYYFPQADILCTEKAVNMMASEQFKLPPDVKNSVYYRFLNKESLESKNVAQLFAITYNLSSG